MRPLKAIPQKEYTSYGFTSLETPLKTELLLVVDLSFYSLEFCKPNCIGNLKLPMKVRLSHAKEISELYAETWPCNVPYACL